MYIHLQMSSQQLGISVMHILKPLDATLTLQLVVCLSIQVQTKSLGLSERQKTEW